MSKWDLSLHLLVLTSRLTDSSPLAIDHLSLTIAGKLNACAGAVKESIVGAQVIADYLLFVLNRAGSWGGYVKEWALESPTDDIDQLLQTIAQRIGMSKKNVS